MNYEEKYKEALGKAIEIYNRKDATDCEKTILESVFLGLKESSDEKIKKSLIEIVKQSSEVLDRQNQNNMIAWLEKQKPQGKPALEVWKDMRLEVYQQASGNRHEPNYSDDSTKMFSLADIDEIFEKVAEKQGEQKPFNNDKYQTVSVKILDRLYESEKELERLKQGEQKPEVVYTKFRVGDVIVETKPNGYCPPVTVKYVGEGAYSCESDDGKRFLSFPIIKQDEYKLVKQKPWSEGDELNLKQAIYVCHRNGYTAVENWLKSIKEIVQPQ